MEDLNEELEYLNSQAENLLAGATTYLIQGQDLYEASLLLLCKLHLYINDVYSDVISLKCELSCNDRSIYDILSDNKNPSQATISYSLDVVLPSGYKVGYVSSKIEFGGLDENWRERLTDVIEGKRSLNQCKPIEEAPRYSWEGMYFRSPVEITIAKALDKYKVLFLPNCMARLGLPGRREHREADFLICWEGKWGILEINGDAYHTNSAKDHERGRLFKTHGIKVFEPYEARRCMKEPDIVVKEFLALLKQNA